MQIIYAKFLLVSFIIVIDRFGGPRLMDNLQLEVPTICTKNS
jgi:hypothetical protein